MDQETDEKNNQAKKGTLGNEPQKGIKEEQNSEQQLTEFGARAFEDTDEPIDADVADSLPIDTSIAVPKRIGLWILFIVFGVFGIWATTAPLEGAAHASGTVTVKSHKKTVQHLEGGIVEEIHVHSGDKVEEGDVLLVLDSTQSRAQLEIVAGQFIALSALEARLISERDNQSEVSFPETLLQGDTRAKEEVDAQTLNFLARKNTREGSMSVLQQRIAQLQSQIVGLNALQSTKKELASSYKDEVKDFSELLDEGFTDKGRLRELERNYTRLLGEVAELASRISAAEIQVGETRLQILQEDNEFRTAVVDELGETQTKLKDVRERVTALQDVVTRAIIKAPVDGVVHGMQIYTIGAVIGPGAPFADIIPQSDELVVEAKLADIDIDRVVIGQDAKIRFSAFSRKLVPAIKGRVIGISADRIVDEATGASYFLARVAVSEEGMKELDGLVLLPGMPAEVFITTGSRTLLQYLFKPITDALARAMIED